MKYIIKGLEPQQLTEWKALENDSWKPTINDLRGNIKIAAKRALMKEQGHLCCYCERRVSEDDSHIEHFRPQSDPAVDDLEFANLLCSCQKQSKKGHPRHCGNLKENWFDEILIISPLDESCEERFAYLGDGSIQPVLATDDAAKETIRRIGLDIPKLRAMRSRAVEPFLDENLLKEELSLFVHGYLEKDERGQFGEFWATIRYLFGQQ